MEQEGGKEENKEGRLVEEKDESYIEIELDSLPCAVVVPTCESSEEEEEVEEYNEELRISISSRIALPDVVEEDQHQCPHPPPTRQANHSAESDHEGTVKLPRAFNNNVGLCCHNPSSDHTHVTTLHTTMPFNTSNHMDLHSTPSQSRGKEGSIRRKSGGMIMKMLIKFRGIKLSTLIPSLIKPPPRPPCRDHNKGHNRKYCRTILKCYHQKNMVVNPCGSSQEDNRSSSKRSAEEATARRLSKPYWDLNNKNNISSNEGSFRSSRRSSWNRSVVEIDLGALKGMFSAVGIAQKGNSPNKRKSRSTMSSCDNSPIHQGFSLNCTTDNSIQAAIAYCKTSLGQTSDFSF